ncbi:MAG: HAD-IA family hydrolase [Corynebacterium sp.]|nr:HAD-IA family hydrolase [Corynebacterium sp.]
MAKNVALLLDVDGTLVDSYEGVVNSYLQALESHGYTHPEGVEVRTILGPPMVQSLAAAGVSDADLEDVRKDYMHRYLSTGWLQADLYAGIEEFLQWAKAQDFILATATSKAETSTNMVLEHFGLREYFDFLGTAGDKGERPSKTDVIAYTLDNIKREFNIDTVIMIGDRKHDIEGAQNNSIPVIAVEWGYGTDQERASATYRAATTTDLERTINEWLA